MFFSSGSGQWLKPVCKMGNTFAFCPGTHTIGNLVGHGPVNLLTGFNRIHQAFISFITQKFPGGF